MSTTVNKVETILKSAYSTKSFVELIQCVFDTVKLVGYNNFHSESSNFSSHIVGYTHVGDYISADNKKIAIFSVKLQNSQFVTTSRNIQRSYAKKLIEAGNCDALVIAFYADDEPKWRLSFVRLDYSICIEQGRVKTTESLTPAKRYSFMLGEDEPCHTALERLHRFIVSNEKLSIDDIEDAFSVERVTKEFFDLYRDKFYLLQETLEHNPDFCAESERCGFTSEQYAKKMLGQIVFLYFLQKKGCLGVPVWPEWISSAEYNALINIDGARGRQVAEYLPRIYTLHESGRYHLSTQGLDQLPDYVEELIAEQMPSQKTWKDGSKNFLRDLFDYSCKHKGNFYENYLKPLFYDTLNKNRGSFGYSHTFHCRIPYFSGGLFEPIKGYDWKSNRFDIPDTIFSNIGDGDSFAADGIFDIFDRYNFTMCEDEPFEKEVAIDPEMLGKIFENLLEVKDKRSKGAFYTPREIVQYMCRETIIKQLSSKTNISSEIIRSFVQYGEYWHELDIAEISHGRVNNLNVPPELFALDSTGRIKINRLNDIDYILASMKIVDPAVGSGAFLLGMITEIVRIRQIITPYILALADAGTKKIITSERSSYNLKYNAIKESVYGVDTELSAVDITRLRLWLSLIIDADLAGVAGELNSATLPNLDSKIIRADSLAEGAKLIQTLTSKKITEATSQCFSWKTLTDKLFAEQEYLFMCDDPRRKVHLLQSIERIKKMMIESSNPLHEEWEKHFSSANVSDLVWSLDFLKVFVANGGFDVVIGNPPYVQLQKSIGNSNQKVGDQYEHLEYQTFNKMGDLYCLFYELGLMLLKPGGCLCYITSNKWLRTAYGAQLRKIIATKFNPVLLIDFAGVRIFETAAVDVNVILVQNADNLGQTSVCALNRPIATDLCAHIYDNAHNVAFRDDNAWALSTGISDNIKNKILSVGKPIHQWDISINYGIKTGFNKVFVIDTPTKEHLCSLNPDAASIMRPLLKGKDIHKWKCCHNGLWLIFVHNGNTKSNIPPVDIDAYPAVKSFMDDYLEALKKRSDQGRTPYHLRDCAYIEDFRKPKIMFQEMVQFSAFAYDAGGEYMCLDTARIVTGERLEYLTGLFNSNLFFFAVKHFFGGGRLGDTGIRMKHTFFKNFSAYVPTEDEEAYIRDVVLSDSPERDAIINKFFYSKYQLTQEEIDYIEQDIG